ncbi:MAG TPA: hypothetical protein VFD69_12815 [Vicinamibacterales bacterium]|nr:hypothetical protein [Vicinamibacterales bacterium]
MRPRAIVAINLTGTAAFISVFFWLGQDHSPLMLLRWTVLFVAALVLPMYWSGKVEAELARLPGPVSVQLKRAAVYPVWVGIFTLGAAIALLERLG